MIQVKVVNAESSFWIEKNINEALNTLQKDGHRVISIDYKGTHACIMYEKGEEL